jgi:putative transposase
MPEKFQNKYRIPSTRLQTWDYSWNAHYFVTICTKDREHFFGEIINEEMQLSEIGKLANKFWLEIPEHFPFVELGNFVIMPNHLHGILIINKSKENDKSEILKPEYSKSDNVKSENVETRHCLVSTDSIGQKRYQNQGKNTLSSIVGAFKSIVTKSARKIYPYFSWQSRFHDHIIRNDNSHNRISDYILNNPSKWAEDKFFS